MSTTPGPKPTSPQIVYESASGPLHVVLEQRTSRFGRFGKRLLWTALAISVLINLSLFGAYQSYFQGDSDLNERYHSLDRTALNKIAIIKVEGTIMGEEGFVKKQIDRVRRDKNVKAIVLRVDSPGGTVTGSDYIYHHLRQLAKERELPMVVSMGSMAASGGYYVAMAAEGESRVYAEPTTWTGSVGVIIPHYDVAGLLAKIDVQDDSIVSHPLKQMGSPTARLSPEMREQERKILKNLVDDSFARFKEIVLKIRPTLKDDEESQKEVFTGRIFTAGQAKNRKLVDEIGFVEDAIARALKLAKLNASQARAVEYKRPLGLMDQIVAGSQSRTRSFDLSSLLDLTAPRAYYLTTWLPPVMASP